MGRTGTGIADWVMKLDERMLSFMVMEQFKATLKEFHSAFVDAKANASDLDEVFGFCALHKNPWVRRTGLSIADRHADRPSARELMCWLVHDPEDFVCFEAVRLCEKHHVTESIKELLPIIGMPSGRVNHVGQPVGMGHAIVLKAVTSLFGTTDKAQLEMLENAYVRHGRIPQDLPTPVVANTADMVFIPHGEFIMGINSTDNPFAYGGLDGFFPRLVLSVDDFFIDRFPVTNAQYDEFVHDIEIHGHRYCHPDEPESKNHRRNTWMDMRFGEQHPVTGIDWYDAWAYAHWAGKDLPTCEQWEKAARGTDGRLYPWGNDFDASALNWIGTVFENPQLDSVKEWRELLTKIDDSVPRCTTVPVGVNKKNLSSYGIYDMSGNCWEYTKTNYFSRKDMNPHFKDLDPVAFMQDHDAFPIIKGGSWTSIAALTSAPFTGKDLLTDRHNEIGFRCVYNPAH